MLKKEKTSQIDLLGKLIKSTGSFKGKGRLIQFWMDNRNKESIRTRVLPGGGKIICDLSIPYEAMVWLKQEEEKDLNVLKNLLKPAEAFVDCGANIGIWTIVAATTVGKCGQIFAFEPNPYTFKRLSKNVSIQEVKNNIHLFPNAVGSLNTSLPFQCCESHNISTIKFTPTKETIMVPVVTLDSVILDQQIYGIKIDVEGFEFEVVKGAERILKNYKPWLCIEYNTLINKINVLQDWNVHQYLTEIGYICRKFYNAFDLTNTTILPGNWESQGYCNLFYSFR